VSAGCASRPGGPRRRRRRLRTRRRCRSWPAPDTVSHSRFFQDAFNRRPELRSARNRVSIILEENHPMSSTLRTTCDRCSHYRFSAAVLRSVPGPHPRPGSSRKIPSAHRQWVATWDRESPHRAPPHPLAINGQTLRQVVHCQPGRKDSGGGSRTPTAHRPLVHWPPRTVALSAGGGIDCGWADRTLTLGWRAHDRDSRPGALCRERPVALTGRQSPAMWR
jgi:hypothetical protein